MKILLVDDEYFIRQFIRVILEDSGHEVFEAENGKIAIEIFDKLQPDLVIMDLIMPVLDGYAATKIIKEKVGSEFVPILFVTSKSDDATLVECLDIGGDDFVSKPISSEILSAKVDVLQKRVKLYKGLSEKTDVLTKINNLNSNDQLESEKIYSRVLNRGKLDCDCIRKYQKASYAFNGDIVMAVKKPDGVISFLVGDFTGHGLPAAICVMPVVDIFYRMSTKGFSLQEIVIEINEKIREFLPTDRFFSAVIFDINVISKKLKIWNAGMPDVLVFSKDSEIKYRIHSRNIPLGIVAVDETGIELEVLDLDEGDLILSYSDGLIEAESLSGEHFGRRNVEKIVTENNASVDVIDHIVSKLITYKSENKFEDDVSLLSVKVNLSELLSAAECAETLIDSGDWQVKFRLEANMLQERDPVAMILSSVAAMRTYCGNRDTLQFILTEMFSNAIEHGLLRLNSSLKQKAAGFDEYYSEKKRRLALLDDGFIEIIFTYTEHDDGDMLEIEMEDSGDGFDVVKTMQNGSTGESDTLYNRGIGLINSLCKSVQYNEKGNKVRVSIACIPGQAS